MREEFAAQDPRSQTVVITSHTSGLSLTAQQPVNNIVRGTMQALSLVLGGANAIEISTFDEAYRTPSKEGHLVGLRTQQIIEAESGVTRVVDPLGGSYFVEQLTDEMEARVLARVQAIEAAGDPETLQQQGYFRGIFHRAMEDVQLAVQKEELTVVGVNAHVVADDDDTMLKDIAETKIPPCRQQVERICNLKRTRDQALASKSLHELAAAVRDGRNLVPIAMNCFDADVTVGEMAGVMRQATGMPYDPFGMVDPVIAVSP
jgi:methylmalonyl-CoA mutase N-terminal domain/subunit